MEQHIRIVRKPNGKFTAYVKTLNPFNGCPTFNRASNLEQLIQLLCQCPEPRLPNPPKVIPLQKKSGKAWILTFNETTIEIPAYRSTLTSKSRRVVRGNINKLLTQLKTH